MSYIQAYPPLREVPTHPVLRPVPVSPALHQVPYGVQRDVRSMPAEVFGPVSGLGQASMVGRPIYVNVPGVGRVNVEPHLRDAIVAFEARVREAAKEAVAPYVGTALALGGIGTALGLLAFLRR